MINYKICKKWDDEKGKLNSINMELNDFKIRVITKWKFDQWNCLNKYIGKLKKFEGTINGIKVCGTPSVQQIETRKGIFDNYCI